MHFPTWACERALSGRPYLFAHLESVGSQGVKEGAELRSQGCGREGIRGEVRISCDPPVTELGACCTSREG